MKTSANRMYTKFATLTAVAAFGAIALAQAQKNGPSDLEAAPEAISEAFAEARPIPLDRGVEATEESAYEDVSAPEATANQTVGHEPQGFVAQTSGELTLPDRPATGSSRSSEWSSTEADAESLDAPEEVPAAIQPPPSRFRRSFAATPAADSMEPMESLAPETPLADQQNLKSLSRRNPYRSAESPAGAAAPEGVSAASADEAGTSAELEAPPLLDSSSPKSLPMPENENQEHAVEAAPSDASPKESYSNELDANSTSLPEPLAPVAEEPSTAQPSTPNSAGASSRSLSTPPATLEPIGEPATEVTMDDGAPTGGGQPGPQTLEGPQVPALTLEKIAPPEIQVGQPATFQIRLRNTGRVAATNVLIRDEIPAGTKFVDATPKANRAADGAIFWEIGTIEPGQDTTVDLRLMPIEEGPIGSVATVSFQASASVRTRATKPNLVLEHTGPAKALVGDTVRFSIKLSNPGSGAANQVVLEEDVPQGLTHSSGPKLEYEVGTIQPGQTRHLELTLKASEAGRVMNTITARADGGLVVNSTAELEVTSPKLTVSIEGPTKRYLDRQANFTISVANPGTADAQNVELVAQLPTGLKFVSTNNSGYYDQARHAVIWSLEKLPAGEMGKAQFTAMPVQMGQFQIRADGQAEMGLESHQEHSLQVEGIAALMFGVADKVDPVEVGGQTSYEIHVVNQGSKPATNVKFVALVPDGLKPVSAEGPTSETISGQQVTFAEIPQLAPKDQATFRVLVEGVAAGDHRFRVQMTSDEIPTPVLKEESTNVYAD